MDKLYQLFAATIEWVQ